MKLLIIEDNEKTVSGIIDFANEHGWEKECRGFDKWDQAVREFQPEIIVLDWMYDVEDTHRGEEILNSIWEKQFRPIIIFSALAESIELPEKIKSNPLIAIILKGDEDPVIQKLCEWENYIPVMHDLKEDMNKALIDSLKVVNMFKNFDYPGNDVVKYMITKRTANYFSRDLHIDNPPAWIQYIYPPIDECFIVCDIIRTISTEADITKPGKAEEYSMILSPSCDMGIRGGLPILIAQCEVKETFSDIRLSTTENVDSGKGKEKVEKITHLLNQGYSSSKVALPEIPGVLPFLTVNLKILHQISLVDIATDYNNIDKERHKFFRVASVDSPFREQIVWAHMLNSCRPGVPVRDTETWAKGVLL